MFSCFHVFIARKPCGVFRRGRLDIIVDGGQSTRLFFASTEDASVDEWLNTMKELSEQDINNIKNLHEIWIAKELEGNGSDAVDLCTEDAQWLPPDAPPIVGKKEIRNYLTTERVNLLTVEAIDVSVQGSGSVAYLISNYTTRYLTEGHSEIAHEAKGTHLWVLRKEGDRWRVAVVTWSSW
jgi:ketosteroid isomerase-like protein